MSSVNSQGGFTLVEILVAVALFAIVMTISVGSLLSLVEANRKTQALQSVMNNLNFAIENISRNMRVGSIYHCSTGTSVPPDITVPQDCQNGGVLLAFETSTGNRAISSDQVVYRFVSGRIEKSSDGGATFIAVTAPEVTIEDLKFYVVGSTREDTEQPRVAMTISGFAGVSDRARTSFNLQTTISQRLLDISSATPPPETPPEPSVAFADGLLSSPTGLVHTFPSVAFGNASSFRKIIVGFQYGASEPSSVMIGGVDATLAVRRSNSSVPSQKMDLWQANVPTGTNGNVVVTFNSPASLNMLVWSTYSLESAVYDTATTDGPGIANTTSLSVPIDVPAGGVVLGFFWATGTSGSNFSVTWTNLTENFETGVTSGYSGAGDSFASAQTNLSVTAQAPGLLPDGYIQLIVVSWGSI